MGYFTLFGSGDYFLMVGPAYFIFSIWVFLGLVYLYKLMPRYWSEAGIILMLLVVTVLNLSVQLKGRYEEARSSYVEQYVRNTFAIVPAGSIVIARWNEFTALKYMQEVEGMRGDLRMMVPAREKRHYKYGEVQDYLVYVRDAICKSPVVTNKVSTEIEEQYRLIPLDEQTGWFQLEPKTACDVSH
jgi:hypothetical protein